MILLTPLYSIGEIIALFQGQLKIQASSATPLFIKAIKDIGFILSIVFSILICVNLSFQTSRLKFFLLCIFIACSAIFLISLASYPYIAFAGLRWLAPVLLGATLIGISDKSWLTSIGRLMLFLFSIHFIAQVIELFWMPPYYGNQILFGMTLTGRVPGIFLIPSTSAFFVMITMVLGYFYVLDSKLKKRCLLLLGSASIFLCQSGTGIVALGAFFTLIIFQKKIKIAIYLTPIILLISLIFLSTITQRVDVLEGSGGKRLSNFFKYLENGELISTSFGSGTNTGILIAHHTGLNLKAIVTDSIYIQIITNIGILPFLFFITLFVLWSVAMIQLNKIEIITFSLIYALFGMSKNITEGFPMNIIFSVCFSLYSVDIFYAFKSKDCRHRMDQETKLRLSN